MACYPMQASQPSFFSTLAARELNQSRVKSRPSLAGLTAEGACPGSGVLTVEPNGASAPPLAISFGKTAENSHLLAVADEEGFVSIFNTRHKLPSSVTSHEKTGNVRKELWLAHNNAIFDISWIQGDRQMLTASGDQSVRLWDIEARAGLGVMKGHTGSVKSLCAHPFQQELFASGSRDGSVALWDMRGSCTRTSTNERCFAPVSTITCAHILNQNKRVRGSKANAKSVTAVLYLKDDRMLATAGAADGVVKFWDTRQLKSPVVQTPQVSADRKKQRVHGISGLSQHPYGKHLIASCTDNRIYVYDVHRPEKGSVKSFQGHILGSFYIKAAFSPDGTHILSGSSDGNVFIWQMDDPEALPVTLTGHGGEVTAVDWCPTDFGKIATCSDDFTVRIWNNLDPRFDSIRSHPSVMRRRITADPSAEVSCRDTRLSEALKCFPEVNGSCSSGIKSANFSIPKNSTPECLSICSDESIKEDVQSPEANLRLKPLVIGIIEATDRLTKRDEGGSPSSVLSPPGSLKRAGSPSSVLSPPGSLKKRKTIMDYYGA